MKKFLALLVITAVISACGSSNDGMVRITGKIKNQIPQGEVILERYETGQITPVLTAYSDHEGNFFLPCLKALTSFGKDNNTSFTNPSSSSVLSTESKF